MQTQTPSPLHGITPEIYYPDSDGLPMANNTLHAEYIISTKYGIESLFADRDDVFVAMDLFWYPVKGKPKTVLAPDVMIAFGRPRGARSSYKQWEENDIAPQVVFEFLSESNTNPEMVRKAIFFERFAVQEYYLYDIERKELSGFIRYQEGDDTLEEIADMEDWISPRLGIRFDMSSGGLVFHKPDGAPFLQYDEYISLQNLYAEERKKAEQEKARADTLAAKLRELGINPDEV
jgi:Uma2 family endonuclease